MTQPLVKPKLVLSGHRVYVDLAMRLDIIPTSLTTIQTTNHASWSDTSCTWI
uniref:Uncharacterized protein n=1 Tax=Helianthus annuus TaxID=4232 RepID=A0A251SCI9_HELAN